MKLGNTSQSIVPVPNFFLTRTPRNLEAFNISSRKKYFREKDLFHMTKDLNFCNNQRKNHRMYDEKNREKYVPIHRQEEVMNSMRSLTMTRKEERKDHRADTDAVETEQPVHNTNRDFRKFTNYMNKTNVTQLTKGDLREDIRSSIGNLLDKINSTVDMNRWNKADTKSTFLFHNTNVFSPITLYNIANDSETTKFKTTLKDKVSSMSVVNETSKERALNFLNKLEEEKTSSQGLVLPNLDLDGGNMPKVNRTLSNTAIKNYQTHSMNDTMSLTHNFSSYENFKKSTLNDFRKRKWRKKKTESEDMINFDKYNSSKHKEMFCENENYLLNEGALKRFKQENQMKSTFN